MENIIGESNPKNLWYQPFNYLSGAMSVFFWVIKNGKTLDKELQMDKWDKELPLSKCKMGLVNFIGNKKPNWYKKILNENNVL